MKIRLLLSFVAAALFALPPALDLGACVETVARVRIGGEVPPGDMLLARVVDVAGWGAGLLTRGFVVFAVVFAGLCALGWLIQRFVPPSWQRTAGRAYSILLVVLCAVALAGAVRTLTGPRPALDDLLPLGLLAAVPQGAVVYANPAASVLVAAVDPSLLAGVSAAERAAAISSAVKWRELDRRVRFGAVLLAGNAAEAQTLIEHLQQSPDWRLAAVDGDGLLFLRGGGASFMPSALPDSEGATEDDAVFVARQALNLQLAGLKVEARERMQWALDQGPEQATVLAAAASLNASQGRWEKTRELAMRALRVDPDRYDARFTLATALLETRNGGKALDETARLLEARPKDVPVLLLRARCARAVNDPDAEIEALERLLVLVPAGSPDAARIHVFLGQAWAKKGFADRAEEAFEAALAAGLDAREAQDVRGALQTIRENRRAPAP